MHRVYTAGCRVFQFCMKLGWHLVPCPTPGLIEGPDCLNALPDLLKKEGLSAVLLVAGNHVSKLPQSVSLRRGLKEQGLSCTLFSGYSPDPTEEQVYAGAEAYRAGGCQAIIAMGGGSAMDCAKAIGACIARPNKKIPQLQGLLKVRKATPPLFAVPTTAGTGSECTLAAVITESKTHRKAAINDPALLPKYALLDASLTVNLSPAATAATAMDALTHAVEAYTNGTYCTEKERRFARLAVAMIHDNLPLAYADGENLPARQMLLKASYLAGRAFTRGCVGYVHALGHPLGSLYGLSHGEAMALLLPAVLRAYGEAVEQPLSQLAHDCGFVFSSPQEGAKKLICWMEETRERMGLPASLPELREEDFPQIISWAMKEANPLYPVPVVWKEEEMGTLLKSLQR